MALRAVLDHPKFTALQQRLKMSRFETLGVLEALWHFTGRFTPRGNIGKYTDAQIESWIEWKGTPGALIAALVAERWLDVDTEFRLLTHDWHKHADKATKQSLKRLGVSIIVPNQELCSPTVHTVGEQCGNTVDTELPIRGTLWGLPEPVPEPESGAGPVPVVDVVDEKPERWPETTEAARVYFPAVDEVFIESLVRSSLIVRPEAGDTDIAAAIHAVRNPRQESPGLWLTTVPAQLRALKRANARAPAVYHCQLCADTGRVLKAHIESGADITGTEDDYESCQCTRKGAVA